MNHLNEYLDNLSHPILAPVRELKNIIDDPCAGEKVDESLIRNRFSALATRGRPSFIVNL
jgi:hypothetical protein